MKALSQHVRWILLLFWLAIAACQNKTDASKEPLRVVTYSMFQKFVKETGYITEAERFGWSIVQNDVFGFTKVEGANWRTPDGKNKPKSGELPVTQVSFIDAQRYCEWSGSRLPTYEEYWQLVELDEREVISNGNGGIAKANKVNVLGNVWEITSSMHNGHVRLAGGSWFCSTHTCNGTIMERELFVDRQTGNVHIGFAVVK